MEGHAEFPWRVVLAGAALVVFGFFLYALLPGLGPLVLFLGLLGLLVPFRGRPGHTTLVMVASLLFTYWVLDTTGFLLAPFVLALVLAYIVDPAVDRLEARGMGRSIAIVLLSLPVAVVFALTVVLGLPALAGQLSELIDQTPVLLGRLADWVESLDRRLEAMTLPAFADQLVQRLREIDPEGVVDFLRERQSSIASSIWGGVLGLGRGLGSALSVLGYIVLTPVLAFYLLRDWDRLTRSVGELIPPARREAVVDFFREYDRLLSRYLRGQITVALIIGVITGVGLWVARFPYAMLLGAIVAVFSVVPYLGLLLSLIPAVFIALVSGSVWIGLAKVAVVYGIAQGLEGAVISPRIVGDSVGLHPVWVVLALAMGGYFFGFVGLLIAVPVAVGFKLLVLVGLEKYRDSAVYAGADAERLRPGTFED